MAQVSPLNDAIRDVLADFEADDRAASNRMIAEEVSLRHPSLMEEYAQRLWMQQITAEVRRLRKRPRSVSATTSRQLPLPTMAEDLLPRLPAEIPRFPENGVVPDEDELPWGSLWISTVGELRRYAGFLLAGIKADTARYEAISELLSMAANGGGHESMRVIDAVHRVEAAE